MQADSWIRPHRPDIRLRDFPISRFRDLEITRIAKSGKWLIACVDVDDVENPLRLIDQDHAASKDHAFPISG